MSAHPSSVNQAHVCVEQTAIELRARGLQVHIVADATTSRTQEDRLLAFEVSKGLQENLMTNFHIYMQYVCTACPLYLEISFCNKN